MTKPGIGSSPRRREDQRLVTGAGTFGDDFTLPGEAFAALARSPHAHAILRSIDATKAKELPGVLAVLTAADYLSDGLKPLAHSPFTVSPPDITLANRDGKPVFVAPHYPLALDRVRFVGEGVVLVVAETLSIAREAAELSRIDHELELQLINRLRDPSDKGAEQNLLSLRAQRELARAHSVARSSAA